jgi:Glycosyltransferase family 29 (sialyltransferase)
MSLTGLYKSYFYESLNQLGNHINGKSVAIIGNASSLFTKNQGAEIDECETIIRLNRGYIIDPHQQGSRTTIIGTSRGLPEETITEKFNPELVVWLTSKRWYIPNWSEAQWSKTEVMPLSLWHSLHVKLQHRPTSGLMMLHIIEQRMTPKKLSIYGFDFYQTGNFYRGAHPENSPHSPAAEKNYVSAMIARNSNYQLL